MIHLRQEAMMRQGGWWCEACHAATELNLDREANVCARCGRPGVRFVEGKGAERVLELERGAEWFGYMRAVVEATGVAATGC